MLNDEICKLRNKLNESIVTGKDYSIIYQLSLELDELIAEYYKQNVKFNPKRVLKELVRALFIVVLHIKIYKKRENIDVSTFSRFYYGGDTRIRTGDQSFADSCLTTWLCRHIKYLEQVVGIGPANQPWQGCILPLNYTCVKDFIIISKYL